MARWIVWTIVAGFSLGSAQAAEIEVQVGDRNTNAECVGFGQEVAGSWWVDLDRRTVRHGHKTWQLVQTPSGWAADTVWTPYAAGVVITVRLTAETPPALDLRAPRWGCRWSTPKPRKPDADD